MRPSSLPSADTSAGVSLDIGPAREESERANCGRFTLILFRILLKHPSSIVDRFLTSHRAEVSFTWTLAGRAMRGTGSTRRSEEDTRMFGIPLALIAIVGFIVVAAIAMYRADQKRKNASSD